MKSKFHWGHGITIFLICFILILITVLVSSLRMNHNLVSNDYYADDLSYQSRYDKEANELAKRNLQLSYDNNAKLVTLKFKNSKAIAGSIHFYRPADESLDFTQEFSSDSVQISTDGLAKGMWRVKVDWKSDGASYYKQEVLIL